MQLLSVRLFHASTQTALPAPDPHALAMRLADAAAVLEMRQQGDGYGTIAAGSTPERQLLFLRVCPVRRHSVI